MAYVVTDPVSTNSDIIIIRSSLSAELARLKTQCRLEVQSLRDALEQAHGENPNSGANSNAELESISPPGVAFRSRDSWRRRGAAVRLAWIVFRVCVRRSERSSMFPRAT